MWLKVYSTLFHTAFLAGFPFLALNALKKGKFKEGLGDRFGKPEYDWIPELADRHPVWIHAVSVGEAQMLPPVIEKLSEHHPGVPVVVSTNTVTGQNVARSLKGVSGAFYSPLDFGWAVRGVIKKIQPRILIIFETEIWPNLIVQTARRNIPVVFLNGRISDKSFRQYLRLKPFMKGLLNCPACFGMRTEEDARKIIDMGADPGKVRALGNLKYESANQLRLDPVKLTREDYGIREDEFLIVGGSTFPLEEDALLQAANNLNRKHGNVRLLLAPRHPERFEDAAQTVTRMGNSLARRSQGKLPYPAKDESPVILLDVMGELKQVYSLADAVFIGKSLGLTPSGCGGQNPLEPAAWAKPILCGPRMENFTEVTGNLAKSGGIRIIANRLEMEGAIEEWLLHPDKARQTGEAAYSVISGSLGAAQRGIEMINEALAQWPGYNRGD